MARIGKRNYPALVMKETGKFYTGYQGDSYCCPQGEVIKVSDHKSVNLCLQYLTYSRGRSAANVEMVDKEGFVYTMSMSGFDLMMQLMDHPSSVLREKGIRDSFNIGRQTNLNGGGVWYTGTFCQTKQGQNYFIEPCEVTS